MYVFNLKTKQRLKKCKINVFSNVGTLYIIISQHILLYVHNIVRFYYQI